MFEIALISPKRKLFLLLLISQKRIWWRHLVYKDLVACLVSESEEEFLPVAKTVPSLPSNILHHRLDLMLQSAISKDTFCSNHNRIMTLGTFLKYFNF